MPVQKLTTQQRRILRRARGCGVLGFTGLDLFSSWEIAKLTELPQEKLDELEECLEDLQALLEALRSPN